MKEKIKEFILKKANEKNYLFQKKEVPKEIFKILNKKWLLIKIKTWLYFIQNHIQYNSIEDNFLNIYNEWLTSNVLKYENAFLGELESLKLIFWIRWKFLNINCYYETKNRNWEINLLNGKYKINFNESITNYQSLINENIWWFSIKRLSLSDILIRLTDKKSIIYNNQEIINLLIKGIVNWNKWFDNEFITEEVKNKFWNRIINFFLNSKINKEIKNKFQLSENKKQTSSQDKNLNIFFNNNDFFPEIKEEKFLFLNLTEDEKRKFELDKYFLIFDSVFEILKEFKRLDNVQLKEKNKEKIIENSKKIKKIDTYHSTTIEWYKIKEEDIDLLMWYILENLDWKSLKDLENVIVVQWYSKAFDYILENHVDFLSEDFIKTIYQKLWSVSYELQKNEDEYYQKRFRTTHKQMRYSIWYSMPQSYQIYTLVDVFIRNVNKIKNSYLKAIVTHFLFVSIQAFEDWNWRISRFLMNSILISNGYNWLTITEHNYRLNYLSNWGKGWDNEGETRKIIQNTFRKFVNFIIEQHKENLKHY